MAKIGILTCEKFRDLFKTDQTLMNLLIDRRHEVYPIVWSDHKNLESYDAVIFRSTWDYFERKDEFNQWLESLENKPIKLFNPLSIIKENIHKFYLKKLEEYGVIIVPTIFQVKTNNLDVSIPDEWNQAVIKPAFSAAAYKTRVFDKKEIEQVQEEYKLFAVENDMLIQKFMPEIISIGETSVIYFNGKNSHAVLKKPKSGDFRVQSIFGGQYEKTELDEEVLHQTDFILKLMTEIPLYARIDGIVIDKVFYLMEVEMIEPDLYMEYEPEAFERFIQAIEEKI